MFTIDEEFEEEWERMKSSLKLVSVATKRRRSELTMTWVAIAADLVGSCLLPLPSETFTMLVQHRIPSPW